MHSQGKSCEKKIDLKKKIDFSFFHMLILYVNFKTYLPLESINHI